MIDLLDVRKLSAENILFASLNMSSLGSLLVAICFDEYFEWASIWSVVHKLTSICSHRSRIYFLADGDVKFCCLFCCKVVCNFFYAIRYFFSNLGQIVFLELVHVSAIDMVNNQQVYMYLRVKLWKYISTFSSFYLSYSSWWYLRNN